MFDFIEDEEQRAKVQEAHDSEIAKVNEGIELKIDEATSGLKTKNEEVIGEKKKLQETLKKFDGVDIDKAKEALTFLENNADVKLIKDGKVDEIIQRETSQLRGDHETVILELSTNLKEALEVGGSYKGLYETKMIDDTLRDAAIAAKVRPEALTDILLRGRNVFTLAEDGSVEARDSEGKLAKTKDDRVLTTTNWIEGMKETSPHYWPGSEGAGAGGGSGAGSDIDAQMNAAADKGDHKEYRRLKAKKAALKNK